MRSSPGLLLPVPSLPLAPVPSQNRVASLPLVLVQGERKGEREGGREGGREEEMEGGRKGREKGRKGERGRGRREGRGEWNGFTKQSTSVVLV